MGKAKRPRDTNQLAKFVVDVATGETDDTAPNKADGQRKGSEGRPGTGESVVTKPAPGDRSESGDGTLGTTVTPA